MSHPLDHDTCSQLLRAYLAGEAGDDAPAVAAHIESCPQCQEERAALRALLAPVEKMTPAERSHLRSEVARATQSSHLEAVASPGRASQRPSGRETAGSARSRMDRRRFAPALSAAAAILLIVTGAALFQHLGSSSREGAAGSAAAPNSAVDGNPNTGAKVPLGAPSSLAAPTFASSVLPDVGQVERQASARLPAFASAYSRAPVEQFAPGLLGRLAETAPAALRSQVLECGHLVIDQPGTTALPAYGAKVTVRGEQILALAFATPNSPAARLEIDGWALGSCEQQILHRSVPTSP